MSIFNRFRRDKRGNVAIMFALSLIPLLGAVGAAVDYTRIAQVRTKLGDALDAGVLALGSQTTMVDAKAKATVTSWMDAHMDGVPFTLTSLTQSNGRITGMASADVEMTLARVMGVNEVTVDVTSQVLKTLGKIELVLVLDNTGSMKGTKISTLKTAAASLVDSLSTSSTSPDNFRVALVPFSQTVNVGPQYQNAAWIDAVGKSASAKNLFLGQQVNRFGLFTKLGAKWNGCVETRPLPYETSDLFDPGDPNSLYVPYFAPDEPGQKGNRTYNNSYLDDTAIATILTNLGLRSIPASDTWKYLQGDVVKYTGRPITGTTPNMGYQYGPNSGCEIAPLLRLSSNTSAVKAAINSMIANGNTDIPAGMAWGWNVVSPNGPFGDGTSYTDKDWTKIVVLMTDGNNENEVGNQEDQSFYSGIGYIWQGRMGVTAGTKAKRTSLRDDRLGAMCDAMKASGETSQGARDGIVIYTIRVEVKNGSSAVLQNCASDAKKFYDVQDVSNLVAAFNDIGNSIKKLRIAL